MKRRFQSDSKMTGFSVLELMFTISLAAILLVLGIPALKQFRQNRTMTAAVSSLHHHLALARNEAVNLKIQVVSCPGSLETGCADSTDWQHGWIMFTDINGDNTHNANEIITRHGPPFENLIIRSTNGRKYLSFSPTAYAPGSNMSIRFCDSRGPAKARKLVVSSVGRIRRDKATETAQAQCPES